MNSLVITQCKSDSERIYMLETCRIVSNRRQPRKSFDKGAIISLADSIHRHGILQPLTVRRYEGGEFCYELVAGERRLRAAQLLKMDRVPCIVTDINEEGSAILAIVENIQRQQLNIFEEAYAISTLKSMYNMTQDEIAHTLSVSQSYIANKLRLLRFGETEQELILENGLTERHCRALLRLEGDQRYCAINHIVRYKLNVAAAEGYVDKLILDSRPKPRVVASKLNDLRVFYNSIDKAVSSVKKLGVDVVTEKSEEADCKLLIIKIKQ